MKTSSALLSVLALSAFCVPAAFAGSPDRDVYPRPHRVIVARSVPFPAEELSPESAASFPVIADALRSRGIVPAGKISVTAKIGEGAPDLPDVSGAYALTVSYDAIEIRAFDEAGIFYAQQTLAQMIEADGKLQPCSVEDFPDIPFRGTVEGFYGKPWEHERRLSQLRFYGKYKMNAYIYGPKDDPYSGFNSDLWRKPYPEAQAKQISDLAAVARENHVNFFWAVHPAATIRWNDADGDGVPDDALAALKKFEAMYALGVRAFAVFFDDIGGEGANAEKQAEMLNFINREFIKKKDGVAPLLMCPTDYAGTHGSAYKKTLGEKLDAGINIMWTGSSICADISADAVETVSKYWRRKPFVWWNWPVNDYCRTNLLLGRVYGLDAANAGKLAGFASNPMDKPEASKIGLFGIADWAWNIGAFDSESSWQASFPRLYPQKELACAMSVFAQHNSDQGGNGHNYRREESENFKPVADAALAEYRATGALGEETLAALAREISPISYSGLILKKTLPQSDPALWHEIEFWVKSFCSLAKELSVATKLASAKNQGAEPEYRAKTFAEFAAERAEQKTFFDEQTERHYEETFPSDKRWATGCRVGTKLLAPLADELVLGEWKKFRAEFDGGNAETAGTDDGEAFTDVPALGKPQADFAETELVLRRILEVVRLEPRQFIGLALSEGATANAVHAKLGGISDENPCEIEISEDKENWRPLDARFSGGELNKSFAGTEKIRAVRLVNASSAPTEFRIERFALGVPANTTEAAFDGDLFTFCTIDAPRTFSAPAGTRVIVVADAPLGIEYDGNSATVRATPEQPARIFEVLRKRIRVPAPLP